MKSRGLIISTIYDIKEEVAITFKIQPWAEQGNQYEEKIKIKKEFFNRVQKQVKLLFLNYLNVQKRLAKREAPVNQVLEQANATLKGIEGDSTFEKLETIGIEIYEKFFPEKVKDNLHDISNSPLLFYSDRFFMPYELSHNGKEFLAIKCPICRVPNALREPWQFPTPPAQPEPARKSVIAIFSNPFGDLPDADQEAQEIVNFLKTNKGKQDLEVIHLQGEAVDVEAFNNVFSKGVDIFHYSGHMDYIEHQEYPFGFMPGLDMGEFIVAMKYFARPPELCFFNMCDSDDHTTRRLISPLSFGAKRCISTLWPVIDETASRFAVEFYRQILGGNSCVNAIQSAKEKLSRDADPNDITWASYVFYAQPQALIRNILSP